MPLNDVSRDCTTSSGITSSKVALGSKASISKISVTGSSSGNLWESDWKTAFRRQLKRWYRRHARDLPWRRSQDPYQVWISEIMLQQTQVATVRGYFERFIKTFPTVEDLAQAQEQQVLHLWQGLGYYRRARQLHAAAREVVEVHQGEFPRDVTTLQSLPGIGRYTAGAICSIAFGKRAPILEANTIRLFSRLLTYDEDLTRSAAQKVLWQAAEELLPSRSPGEFNQALMELGSEVCLPRNPGCESCPVRQLCPTYAQGMQDQIPRPKTKQVFEDVREGAVVVWRGRSVLLLQQGEGGRWAGLWDFPRFPLLAEHPQALQSELVAGVLQQTGVQIRPHGLLTTIRHGVTRFRISLECYEASYQKRSSRRKATAPAADMQWVKLDHLEDYPTHSSARKLAKLITKRGHAPKIASEGSVM